MCALTTSFVFKHVYGNRVNIDHCPSTPDKPKLTRSSPQSHLVWNTNTADLLGSAAFRVCLYPPPSRLLLELTDEPPSIAKRHVTRVPCTAASAADSGELSFMRLDLLLLSTVTFEFIYSPLICWFGTQCKR